MENVNTNPNTRLIPFLRSLADSIEKQQLAPRQIESIGEFFMDYQFTEQAVRDMDTSSSPPQQFNNQDLLKFVTLGWYIYCCILDQTHISSTTDDAIDLD